MTVSSSSELGARVKGVHAYAATPFRPDDLWTVDRDALASNLQFLADHGVQIVAVGGGTGEIDSLSAAELVAIAATATEVLRHRAVVIAAVPGNAATAAELLPSYERLGVDAVLAMPPSVRGRVPDMDGIVAYYAAVTAQTDLPIMPYNTQLWPLPVFVRLADLDGVFGIKDACFDPHPLFQAIQALGDRFVWIGNKLHDPGVLHLRYQMGIEGFTSGMANFLPEPELLLHEAGVRSDWDTMIALQRLCVPLERARNTSDDAAMIKACMNVVGLRGGSVRPPRCDIDDGLLEDLALEIGRLNRALDQFRSSGHESGISPALTSGASGR